MAAERGETNKRGLILLHLLAENTNILIQSKLKKKMVVVSFVQESFSNILNTVSGIF